MRFLVLLLLISDLAFSQVTPAQYKALNAYVDYANQSAQEVASLSKSIMDYYPAIHQKKRMVAARFVCPVQLDDYYYTKAQTDGKLLNSPSLAAALKDLRTVAEKIDQKCKDLDTYHKLEDYKQDNYAKAEAIISGLPSDLNDYRLQQQKMQLTLEEAYKKLQGPVETAYRKADVMMRQQVARERLLLGLWNYNLKNDIHTGWPVTKLEQSIAETDEGVNTLKKFSPALKYPASSMWTSFQGSLTSVLEEKRRALDGYNTEAKKSDRHSNEVYLGLINYFNGTLVSNYNTFIQFSERDNYYGLKFIEFVPLFEIKTEPAIVKTEVKPFVDIPRSAVVTELQKSAITKPVYGALSNYIDFINETWRQVRYMQMVLRSFNSTTAYYKTMDSYDKRAPMSFDYKDFQVPLSSYQKMLADSKALPPAISRSLNEQATDLLEILKEIDAHGAAIEFEVAERKYEADHLKKIYDHLERLQVLTKIWDEKKEFLYQDVRKVYESFPSADKTNSWWISGKALESLTDMNRDALFKAKYFYTQDSSVSLSTDKIAAALRNVIAKEYDNMKGIEKIGRNNGLCPYTPYEDLPETSRLLSEKLKKLKPLQPADTRHPYEGLVYLYNEIVDDYNKFCELSKEVLLLKTVHQPELFFVKYPQSKPANHGNPEQQEPHTNVQEKKVEQVTAHHPADITKIIHDTVYIEKRDTVYIADSGENLRSMEGYATNNMVLLLDVSGSMNTPEKLPLLKKTVLDMLTMMRQEDEVAIVVFSGKAKVLLQPSSFKEENKIKNAISQLTSSGKTDGNAGLKLAYKVADENYIRGGNNRIIMATDGEFPVSKETEDLISKFTGEDIFLSIFNFGKSSTKSKTLENLSSLGKGNYEYITAENIELKLIREVKSKRKK